MVAPTNSADMTKPPGTGVVRGARQQVHVFGQPAPERDLALLRQLRPRVVERAVHDALRPPGRARRVEDRWRERLAGHERDIVRDAVVDEGIDEVEIVDEHLGRRVLDDVRDLVRLQVGVHEHDRALQLRHRGPHLEEGDRIREHDRDAIAGPDAPRREAARDEIGPGVEVDVADREIVLDERRLLGCAHGGCARAVSLLIGHAARLAHGGTRMSGPTAANLTRPCVTASR